MPDSLSPSDRLKLIDLLNSLTQPDFERLVYAIGAPNHLIPSNFAAQGNRSTALLQWVNSPTGCGMDMFLEVLDKVAPGEFNVGTTLPTPKNTSGSTYATPLSNSPSHSKTVPASQSATKPNLIQEDLGDGTTLDLVLIPRGSFFMGKPKWKDYHNANVAAFYMGKYPVTQKQWKAVSKFDQVERIMYPFPSKFKGDNLPVEKISWEDAVEFCKRLARHTSKNYRLPSEAEWEYACRAGTETSYSFGESISKEQVNCNNWYGKTTEVGRFPSNAFGLHDMHGNVWEWCEDYYHKSYAEAPSDGSAHKDRNFLGVRVLRGGSWRFNPRGCQSASRYSYYDYNLIGLNYFGFRVVCSLNPL